MNRAKRSPEAQQRARALTNGFIILVKSAMVHELNNEAVARSIDQFRDALTDVFRGNDEVVLRFVEEMVYVNGVLVRPDMGLYEMLQSVERVLANLKMREVTISGRLDRRDLREFLKAIKKYMTMTDGHEGFHAQRFDKIHVRDIKESGGQVEMSDQMRALRAYLAALLTLKSLILRIEQNKKVSIAPTKRATRDLTTMVYANEAVMLGMIQMRRYRGRTFNRLVNCAVIAVAMCHRLGVDRVAAAETALGAVLHDLDWTGKRDRKKTVHQLVRIYRGERVGRLRVTIASDVGRVDGLGPSRVIGVASQYEKLTTIGDNKDGPILPDEALRRIEADARFDKIAVKLLVTTLGVYPVGTTVQLDDGCIAIVVELPDDGRSLAEPIVKVVKDAGGGGADGRLEDLSQSGTPDIARTLEPEPLELNVTHFFLA